MGLMRGHKANILINQGLEYASYRDCFQAI